MSHAAHKLRRAYAEARLSDVSIEYNTDPMSVVRQAESEKVLHKFKPDIVYCAYKTKYDNSDAVRIIFTMLLPGPATGSSASSEIVMSIVSFLEELFLPLDHIEFMREVKGKKKNIAILSIIKKEREGEDPI
ncbi:MAG: hypothetical protein KAS32_14170 [Candidatus Peribacteraceae bacterium]|nr:hypothetical protein [Candidatus Peribacteraceae bacterium]